MSEYKVVPHDGKWAIIERSGVIVELDLSHREATELAEHLEQDVLDLPGDMLVELVHASNTLAQIVGGSLVLDDFELERALNRWQTVIERLADVSGR